MTHNGNIAQTTKPCDTTIGSIFILQTEPIGGLWFAKGQVGFDLKFQWQMRDGRIDWKPFVPANAPHWEEKICQLVEIANKRRESGAFLRLSETSATRYNFNLPAIGACLVRDETCQSCYALVGWYRVDQRLQVDRALRLEYLQELIEQDNIVVFINWMVKKLNALRPEEPFPAALSGYALPGQSVYLRWHDSGDLFDPKYALAIFKICEQTPGVAHFLPTRRGALISSLVQQGARIPNNLSIQVSVHRGGILEQSQTQSVHEVLKTQPSARIGLSYFVTGTASREVDVRQIQDAFGRGATVCPIIVAKNPEERVCAGCRRCWAANIDSPVIYPKY